MQETRPTILYYGHHHQSMPIRHWCKFWGGRYVGFLCGFWVVLVVNGVLRLLLLLPRGDRVVQRSAGRADLHATGEKFTENRIADRLIKCIWKLYSRMKELTIDFSSQRESTLPRT
jgi:hypothetical protein